MRSWILMLARLLAAGLMLARLLAAAVLLTWLFFVLLVPPAGDREFRRSLEALKKVNSIHYDMVADVPIQRTEEQADLVCASDTFHLTTNVTFRGSDKALDLHTEIIRSGAHEFRRLSSGLWKRDYSGRESARTTCQRLAQSTSAWVVPDMDRMLQHGIIVKGDKKKINGELCREWKITLRDGLGPLLSSTNYEHRTICLGVDDHLPREMTIDDTAARWTYAFNAPIDIEAPTDLEPEPQRNTYQPPPPGLTLSDDTDAK